jgi:PhnB protein
LLLEAFTLLNTTEAAMPSVSPVPKGFHTVTPYLLISDVAGFIDFAKAAFGAVELDCMKTSEGKIMHAQIRVGDSILMMGEAPAERTGAASLYLYVPDVDDVYAKAMAAGGTSIMPVSDQFYGDRNGGVKDRWGNLWWIATHKEEVTADEMQRRMDMEMKRRTAPANR